MTTEISVMYGSEKVNVVFKIRFQAITFQTRKQKEYHSTKITLIICKLTDKTRISLPPTCLNNLYETTHLSLLNQKTLIVSCVRDR